MLLKTSNVSRHCSHVMISGAYNGEEPDGSGEAVTLDEEDGGGVNEEEEEAAGNKGY